MQEFELNFTSLSRTEFEEGLCRDNLKKRYPNDINVRYRYEKTLKELKEYSNDFIDIDCKRINGVKFLNEYEIANKLASHLKVSIDVIQSENNLIKTAYINNLNKILTKQITHNFGRQLEIYLRTKYYGDQTNTWWYEKGPLHRNLRSGTTINDFPNLLYDYNFKWIPNENKLIKFIHSPYSNFHHFYGNKNTTSYERDTIITKLFELGDFKVIFKLDGEIKNDIELICRYQKVNNRKGFFGKKAW